MSNLCVVLSSLFWVVITTILLLGWMYEATYLYLDTNIYYCIIGSIMLCVQLVYTLIVMYDGEKTIDVKQDRFIVFMWTYLTSLVLIKTLYPSMVPIGVIFYGFWLFITVIHHINLVCKVWMNLLDPKKPSIKEETKKEQILKSHYF